MIVDVEVLLKRMQKLVNAQDTGKISELRLSAGKIKGFILEYLSKYGGQINPAKANILDSIAELLNKLQASPDLLQITGLLDRILSVYEQYNIIPAVYLLRHPEKFNPEQTGPQGGERELTTLGVKQAKEFADFLIYEMMITNAPVNLFVEHSYYKRTKIAAEIIALKGKYARDNLGKTIKVSISPNDLLSGDLIKIPSQTTIVDWLQSKNAIDVAESAKAWFLQKKPVSKAYAIYVGWTHLPNVAAFLHYVLNLDTNAAEQFKYADFIKMEGNRYYYDKKWH